MPKFLAISIAYLLFWAGHFVSRGPMSWTDSERAHDVLYPIYNWLMCTSSDLDKWDILWKSE